MDANGRNNIDDLCRNYSAKRYLAYINDKHLITFNYHDTDGKKQRDSSPFRGFNHT